MEAIYCFDLDRHKNLKSRSEVQVSVLDLSRAGCSTCSSLYPCTSHLVKLVRATDCNQLVSPLSVPNASLGEPFF